MARRLLTITILATAMWLSTPLLSAAYAVAYAGIEQLDEPQVTITVSQQTVSILGAQGETLEVVSLTGKKLLTVKIDSPAQRIELNVPKGCYILKVGKVVRKVTIR